MPYRRGCGVVDIYYRAAIDPRQGGLIVLLELKAVYSNQKGFYGKACVHEVNSRAARAMGSQQYDTAARPRVFGAVLR